MPTDDQFLIRNFVKEKDADSFEVLVHRYTGLVYHAALRRGAPHALAQEITQDTFATLARKASTLTHHENLAGWLHTTALFTCRNTLRKERRHSEKMENFRANSAPATNGHEWDTVSPILDEAIGALRPPDREVVLQRYFSGQTTREIAAASGKTEAATQKRITRALKKLSILLGRRGVTLSTTALAAGLGAQLARSVPEGLAAAVLKTALAASNATVAATTASSAITLNILATSKFAAVALVFIGAAIPITIDSFTQTSPQSEPQSVSASGETPDTGSYSKTGAAQEAPADSIDALVAEALALAKESQTADPITIRQRALALQLRVLDLSKDEIVDFAPRLPILEAAPHSTGL